MPPAPRRAPLSASVALASLLAAACVPQVEAPGGGGRHGHHPATRPAPQYMPTTPAVPAAPVSQDWRDAPRTPGDWTWGPINGGTRASYGDITGASLFSLTCNRAARSIVLMRPATVATPVAMQIVTTYGARNFTASPVAGGVAITLAASDPQLDAMAFSRGRFAVFTSGAPTLYLPSWAEVGRVIEDCR